jgi:hypothetical protein
VITLLGTSAGAVAFQAYLVEGLARWNRERALQDRVATDKLRSFDITLMHRVNALSTAIYNEAALTNFSTPSPYTGEVIGVKYLRLQTGDCPDAVQDLDREIDEAFGEFEMGSDEEEGDSRTDETVAHPEDSGDSGNEVISK